MLVRIANKEDLHQTVSDLGLPYLSRPFCQATVFRNFKTFAIYQDFSYECVTKI